MRMKKNRTLWMGVVGVKAKPGSDFLGKGVIGGYSNLVTYASSTEDFKNRVTSALSPNVIVEVFEDIRDLTNELNNDDKCFDVKILSAIERTIKFGGIQWATWHVYRQE